MDEWIKQNKITISIIIVLLIAFSFIYFSKSQVKEVSDIDVQSKCAVQAKSFFEYYLTDLKNREGYEYSNHYNTNFNKCFILLWRSFDLSSPITIMNNTHLFDAIEKKEYGYYSLIIRQGSSSTEMFDCKMFSGGNQDNSKTCKTEAEFNAFIKQYMEN